VVFDCFVLGNYFVPVAGKLLFRSKLSNLIEIKANAK
jgi:hypothetical protein